MAYYRVVQPPGRPRKSLDAQLVSYPPVNLADCKACRPPRRSACCPRPRCRRLLPEEEHEAAVDVLPIAMEREFRTGITEAGATAAEGVGVEAAAGTPVSVRCCSPDPVGMPRVSRWGRASCRPCDAAVIGV
jgi:hypothetical protein